MLLQTFNLYKPLLIRVYLRYRDIDIIYSVTDCNRK